MGLEYTYHIYKIPWHVEVHALFMLLNASSHQVQDFFKCLYLFVPLQKLSEGRHTVHPEMGQHYLVLRGSSSLEEDAHLIKAIV